MIFPVPKLQHLIAPKNYFGFSHRFPLPVPCARARPSPAGLAPNSDAFLFRDPRGYCNHQLSGWPFGAEVLFGETYELDAV